MPAVAMKATTAIPLEMTSKREDLDRPTNVRLVRNLYKSLARLEVLRYKPKTYWELFQKLHDRLGDSEGARQMVDILLLHGQHLAVAVEQADVVMRLSPVDTYKTTTTV
jgi:hypothetical protein